MPMPARSSALQSPLSNAATREEDAGHDVARQHDAVRQPVRVEIDERQHDADRREVQERDDDDRQRPAGLRVGRPSQCSPKALVCATSTHHVTTANATPVIASTTGYRGEIGAPHDAHLPRSAIHPSDRHVLPWLDRRVAVRATALAQERDVRRHAVRDDVQKRADDEPNTPATTTRKAVSGAIRQYSVWKSKSPRVRTVALAPDVSSVVMKQLIFSKSGTQVISLQSIAAPLLKLTVLLVLSASRRCGTHFQRRTAPRSRLGRCRRGDTACRSSVVLAVVLLRCWWSDHRVRCFCRSASGRHSVRRCRDPRCTNINSGADAIGPALVMFPAMRTFIVFVGGTRNTTSRLTATFPRVIVTAPPVHCE